MRVRAWTVHSLALGGIIALVPFASRADGEPPEEDAEAAPATAPAPTHVYTLPECLELTERNHPNLWAARARLAYVHAQLDEAKWTPFWQWTANVGASVLPPITGTGVYTTSAPGARNVSLTDGLEPVFHFDLNGVVPVYTFGKITAAKEAATAGVRVSEWEMEKSRQQARMDVRRAYYGVLLSRDAKYLAGEIESELDKAIKRIKDKIARDDKGVSDVDALRLEVLKEEVIARAGEATRGESVAMLLRFLTGVESHFDGAGRADRSCPPCTPLAPVVRYLAAARLFRPEVNMARAGVAARKAQVDLARAKICRPRSLLGTDYTRSPSATTQTTAWASTRSITSTTPSAWERAGRST